MGEIWLPVGGRNIITARLELDKVYGRNWAGQPRLCLGMQLQLLMAGEQSQIDYTLVRLAGRLQHQQLGEFASFEVGPVAEVPNANPFFRQQDVFVALDRQRIERFEEARGGNDARFQVVVTGVIWHPREQKFEVTRPSGSLEVVVPRSLWIDRVLSPWNLSKTRVIEITFPDGPSGEKFRNSYTRIDEAEKHYASGEYKQVLTTLRIAFEGLAKEFGFPSAGKEFFESLFDAVHPDKREKAREALNGIYRFLHLGPHEQTSEPNSDGEPVINRQDARFALISAQAAFGYMTPRS